MLRQVSKLIWILVVLGNAGCRSDVLCLPVLESGNVTEVSIEVDDHGSSFRFSEPDDLALISDLLCELRRAHSSKEVAGDCRLTVETTNGSFTYPISRLYPEGFASYPGGPVPPFYQNEVWIKVDNTVYWFPSTQIIRRLEGLRPKSVQSRMKPKGSGVLED